MVSHVAAVQYGDDPAAGKAIQEDHALLEFKPSDPHFNGNIILDNFTRNSFGCRPWLYAKTQHCGILALY